MPLMIGNFSDTAERVAKTYWYDHLQCYLKITNTGSYPIMITVSDEEEVINPGKTVTFDEEFKKFAVWCKTKKSDTSAFSVEVSSYKNALANLEGGGGGGDFESRISALESAVLANSVAIQSFTISSSTPSSPVEVGRQITQIVFNWAIQGWEGVASAKIRNTTDSADIHTVTSANGPVTKSVSLSRTTPGTKAFQLQVVAGSRSVNSSSVSVEWRYPTYWGSSNKTTLNESDIKALATKYLRSSTLGTYTIDEEVMGYKWVCIQKDLQQPTSWEDDTSGFAVPMEEPIEVTITGDYGVPITLKCYRTKYSFDNKIVLGAKG